MMMTQCKQILSACAVLLILCASTFAGTIQFPPAPVASGPGLGLVVVPVVSTLSPNNDNFPTNSPNDNNIVVPLKRFDNNDYIDIQFTVINSIPTSGVTVSEYRVSESVDNNTGLNWIGYTMQLGTGVGAGFVKSGAGDGLDFDAPLFDPTGPTSTSMGIGLPSDEDEIVFSGNQGSGLAIISFRIDVPNLTGGTFTLRQFPIPIPEPATALMLVLGCLAAPMIARRRAS
jgi:hypothetical protein